MDKRNDLPPLGLSALRIVLRLALIFAFAFAIHALMTWLLGFAEGRAPALMGGILALVLLAYAALIAVPFVPGIEIGLALLMLSGPQLALPVYLCTVTGLTLAFLVGRWVPYSALRRVFLDLRLRRAAGLVAMLEPLPPTRRLALLRRQLPARLGPLMVKYRYVGLAILINTPGNALIGGGGGICLIAGLSRLFHPRAIVLTLAIAVAPVPLAVWVFGIDILH